MATTIGTSGKDMLNGTSEDDIIKGLSGDDTLYGKGGDDSVIGGAGTDIAKYDGKFSDYSFTTGDPASGGFRIKDLNPGNGNEGQDTTAGVEKFQFADATASVFWTPATTPFSIAKDLNPNQSGGGGVDVEALANGGWVVKYHQDDGFDHLALFDAAGGRVGGEYTSHIGEIEDIATLSGGDFLFVTTSGTIERHDGGGNYVAQYGSYFSGYPSYQTTRELTPLADGGFFYSWKEYTYDYNTYQDTFVSQGAQRYNAAGQVIATYAAPMHVEGLANGGFVETFISGGNAYARLYNAAGTMTKSDFLLNTDHYGQMFSVELSALPNGGFVAAWNFSVPTPEEYYDDESHFTLQRFTASSQKTGAAQEFWGRATDITTLQDGGFIVSRGSDVDEIGTAATAQRFTSSGTKAGEEQFFGFDTADAAGLADGGYVYVYGLGFFESGGDSTQGIRYTAFNNQVGTPRLTITGDDSPQTLTGLAGNDTISGGAGDDVIDGREGEDSMSGGTGNDLYYVDNVKDVITEKASEGTDSVYSALSYTLPVNVENLSLLGTAANGTGNGSTNTLIGNYAANVLSGLGGNDIFVPLGGNDTVDGGTGFDSVAFTGVVGGYRFSDLGAGRITVSGPDGTDTLNSIEQLSFANLAFSIADRSKFDPIFYLEHNRDVANAGVDPLTHYKVAGWAEGRNPNPTLDLTKVEGLEYIASYSDLIKAFGANEYAGKAHFATQGLFEGRTTTFDGLEYIASYGDLINAFHAQVAASAYPENIGATHYIGNGYAEHRSADLFDAAQYLANYADLQAAFGTNTEAATLHYITAGYFEGRTDHASI